MATGASAQSASLSQDTAGLRWSITSRVAFRFCFVYFGFFCAGSQFLGGLFPLPKVDIPDPASLWPTRQLIFWTAEHVFHAQLPLVYTGSGSGDKTFDWVFVFCLLVISTLTTTIWSVLDHKQKNYGTLYKWFHLFIRFALASELLLYGMDKVIPLQMPFPPLTKLLEPFRDFSPMGVLWSSIGASPAYEMFAGSAEMLAGLLLLLPRTVVLGALVCVADMTQVFMLNMTYDVPVKLLSFHLLLMAVFLVAPEFSRLADFFFRNRAAAPSMHGQMFHTRRANRIALALQVLFGLWLVGMNAYRGNIDWHTYGGARPKSPLYGIWNVSELSVDGQLRSPLLTDYDRWRRAIFDAPERVTFQRMDDSFVRYVSSINANDKTIALTKDSDKNWKANFTFLRASDNQLLLDGNMDTHKIHMRLELVDRSKFMLVNRGFHWVQEYPFNR